jgi:hypothetical protein
MCDVLLHLLTREISGVHYPIEISINATTTTATTKQTRCGVWSDRQTRLSRRN